MLNLKLTQVRKGQYECSLTKELDNLINVLRYGHYVMIDKYWLKEKLLPIRLPGRTIGNIDFDDNLTITNIRLRKEEYNPTLHTEIDTILEKYIGYHLEI